MGWIITQSNYASLILVRVGCEWTPVLFVSWVMEDIRANLAEAYFFVDTRLPAYRITAPAALRILDSQVRNEVTLGLNLKESSV